MAMIARLALLAVVLGLVAAASGDTISNMRGCPSNLTLTLRDGEEIRGPTTTNTPPDNPLQFTIREGAVLRGPLIISVCGTDARIEVSQP